MVSGMNTRPAVPAQTVETAADHGRAAFETWARSIGIAARRMEAPDAQYYSDAMSEGMWYAWIAGRAALAAAPQPAAAEPKVKYVPVDGSLRDSNWRHPSDDEPRSEACMKALRDRGDSEGQGLDGYWKWGFAAGFNAAQPAASTVPATDIGARICRAVAELPDRNSPEDWPEAMLVTHDELLAIVAAEMQVAAPAALERESQIAREDRQLAATFGVMEGMKVIALILGGRPRLEELTAAMSGPLKAIERAHRIASSNESGTAC